MPVVHRPATIALLATLLTAPAPTVVHAADYPPTNLQARAWAATYASCHHTDTAPGAKLPAQTLPPLADRSQTGLIDTMQAFRSDTRLSMIVGQIARGYGGVQVATIAGWLLHQPQEAP